MSDLQIALIAEGPTDYPIIKAALNAFMPRPFILNLLQPEPMRSEPSQPDMGSGWGGVLKWCNAYCELHDGLLDEHPLLELYDMLIIHLDVDVSTKRYSDYGPQIADLSTQKSWGGLPCAQPTPPVSNTILALTQVLESWLLPMTRGSRTVLCLPAQSSGTWLAVATVPEDERMIILLRYVNELSYSEISELCELPVSSVRNKLHRAKIKMRASVKREGGYFHELSNDR